MPTSTLEPSTVTSPRGGRTSDPTRSVMPAVSRFAPSPCRLARACHDPRMAGRTGAYHPRAEHARRRDRRLRVPDATAMAVGGMIGGGIFSVLGVAIALAGHL